MNVVLGVIQAELMIDRTLSIEARIRIKFDKNQFSADFLAH